MLGKTVFVDKRGVLRGDRSGPLSIVSGTEIRIPVVQRKFLARLAKRLMDVAGASLLLIVLLPLMLLVGLGIKLTSRGPMFFVQNRVGRGGAVFPLIKFRTMFTEAESMREALLEYNEADGPVFKIKRDPRITPIGRFLRKYSIDELPQLINVLRNEMSLVGPRPPLVSEVRNYKSWQLRRLTIKPGLTCIWQVQGRSIPYHHLALRGVK